MDKGRERLRKMIRETMKNDLQVDGLDKYKIYDGKL